MGTAKKAASTGGDSIDAIAALTADHRRVKALFKEFDTLRAKRQSDEEKAGLVKQICRELKVHTAIEEEIFYPAVREMIDDEDLMDEALVEHAGAKDLVEQLETMEPADELYDAKVTVLGEHIDHHVKEEEGEIFPKAKKAKVDTATLGEEMAQRKTELKGSLSDEDGWRKGARAATPSPHGSRRNS